MHIGVLALQGAFREHLDCLAAIPGVRAREIRRREDAGGELDGLVLPGGESTVQSRLLLDLGLHQPLADAIQAGLPVLGTCAGMILLAREVEGQERPPLGGMDITVRRNGYGRQVDSFHSRAEFAGRGEIPLVFIRAPMVIRVGPAVRVVARERNNPVAVRQENILATAFHPELTPDGTVHGYFAAMAASYRRGRLNACPAY